MAKKGPEDGPPPDRRILLGTILGGAVAASLYFLPATTGAQSRSLEARGEARGRTQTIVGKTLHVEWERTGGFAGIRMAATVDTESLSREDADQLRALVEAAGFFDLLETIGGPEAGGADRFLYTVVVETEGVRHTVHTSEAAAPPALRSLIRWLTNVARRGRQGGGAP